MKATLYSKTGEKKSQVDLPALFETPVRQDTVEKYLEAQKFLLMQPYSPNPKAGRTLVEAYLSKFPTLDILVINTGGPQKNNFADVSSHQWQEDFNSLWMSTVESLQAALPKMKEQGSGRVILVTSVAGKEPMDGLTTSNGFRAGLMGLNKSISKEYAQFGITFNVLLPGFTNTDRLKNLNLSDEFVNSIVPAGRLGKPEEIADLATFLASEKAGYINGQSIAVDGGYLNSY